MQEEGFKMIQENTSLIVKFDEMNIRSFSVATLF